MEFSLHGLRSLPLFRLSIGIGYLTGSSTDAKNQVALVTEVSAVKESLKGTDGLTLDYKDEAAAKKAIKDEKAAAYLTVDEKDGQLEATYVGDQAMKTDLKSLVAAKLSQVQQGINLARANLSKEQLTALSQQVSLKEKLMRKRRLENGANHGCRWSRNAAYMI